MVISESKKRSTKDQITKIGTRFRQGRDRSSKNPLATSPNARLERRREIDAIQAKMAHPQNNWKPRLKEEYLIVRLKARTDGQSSIGAKNIANLRLRCAFIGK